MLSGIVFPWSPDFPPLQPFGCCNGDHPTGWQPDISPAAIEINLNETNPFRLNFVAFMDTVSNWLIR